ncbi:MAG: chemotaxis protein CheD [Bryobacterales bacterium]|nr:chemotaxis protein CheD [Bryobacterales bacterium]
MSFSVVGVGDCKVSCSADLMTYALGSCIGLMVYDPVVRIGGLLHFMLPESSISPLKAVRNPFLFADTGIPLLFRAAYRLGAEKDRMTVCAVGGAQIGDDNGVFAIGRRNTEAMRKRLSDAGVPLWAEETGGAESRTVRLEVSTGRLWVRGPGEAEREIRCADGRLRAACWRGGMSLV